MNTQQSVSVAPIVQENSLELQLSVKAIPQSQIRSQFQAIN